MPYLSFAYTPRSRVPDGTVICRAHCVALEGQTVGYMKKKTEPRRVRPGVFSGLNDLNFKGMQFKNILPLPPGLNFIFNVTHSLPFQGYTVGSTYGRPIRDSARFFTVCT